MSYFNSLDVARKRAAFIQAARDTSDDVFNALAVPACAVAVFGFLAFGVCAVFGARLAAVYTLCVCLGVFAALFIIAHVARFVVFNVKTWNA